ncbi:hypothetical protein ACFFRR_003563 [Megaselia abdita]
MDLGDRNLRIESVLGNGSFGVVYLCRDLAKNSKVCVKIVKMKHVAEVQAIKSEIYILSKIKHPRVIQFLRSYIPSHGTVGIVMEYAPGGTLKKIIDRSAIRPPTDSQICSNICDLIMGLEYLHIRHVVHRDLKPENILIDSKGRLKIADFGISAIKHSSNKQRVVVGSPLYMAPECHFGSTPNFQSDIWALGLICYEIVCGTNPLRKLNSLEQIRYYFKMSSIRHFNCIEIRKPWKFFCSSCLQFEPTQRFTIPQLISNHFTITLHYYNQYFKYDY